MDLQLPDTDMMELGQRFDHARQLTDRVILLPCRCNTSEVHVVGQWELSDIPPAWEVLIRTERQAMLGGMGAGEHTYSPDTYPVESQWLGIGYLRPDGRTEVRVNYRHGRCSGMIPTVLIDSSITGVRERVTAIMWLWRDNRQAFMSTRQFAGYRQ